MVCVWVALRFCSVLFGLDLVTWPQIILGLNDLGLCRWVLQVQVPETYVLKSDVHVTFQKLNASLWWTITDLPFVYMVSGTFYFVKFITLINYKCLGYLLCCFYFVINLMVINKWKWMPLCFAALGICCARNYCVVDKSVFVHFYGFVYCAFVYRYLGTEITRGCTVLEWLQSAWLQVCLI